MKTTLIHGPAKSGKTKYILNKFSENIRLNPVIITTSSESVYYLKKLILSQSNLYGFCGHRIITFDYLVNSIMEDCSEISDIAKYMIINNIVNKIDLKHFHLVKSYRGFYELLSRFITELKSAEITPDIFLEGINKKGALPKDKELYTIYSEYQKELHRLNVYDHEGKFWGAQKRIENGGLGPIADCKLLLVDGFQNFSPTELKIIKNIGKFTSETVLTLTLGANNDGVFAPTIKTYNVLKKRFGELKEICLASPPAGQKSRIIISCPGQLRELEETAKEIKKLIIHKNRRPNDIAILFRDLTEYRDIIDEVFNKYGIPFYIPTGIPLIRSPQIVNLIQKFRQIDNLPPKAAYSKYLKLLNGLINKLNIKEEDFSSILSNLNLPDFELTSIAFYDLLIYVAETAEYRPDDFAGDKVQILDAHRSRGLSFPVVFIGGLIEKSFPKQIAEEPLYGDLERNELRKHGVDVEESKEKQKQEMFLFYNAIHSAEESLYLTYPATDSQGREELPSYYLDEINKAYPEKTEKIKVHLSNVIPDLTDAYTNEQLTERVIFNYWNDIKDPFTTSLYFYLNGPQLLQKASVENNRIGRYNGIITDENILKKISDDYGPNYKYSVSQFNDYGACPFIYFSKRILDLEPIEELRDEIDPAEEGNVYHAILQEFYKDKGDIKAVAEKHFKTAEEKGIIKNMALWNIKKKAILKNINNIIQYEADEPPPLGIKRTPAYFETPFGMNNVKPLEISSVKIQGKIDRIDMTESGLFVVVDYKSGGKIISLTDILKGTNIQLPIYIMAVSDALDIGVDALEAYFLYIRRRKYYHASSLTHYKRSGKKLKLNPKWDEYIASAKKYAVSYAKNIREGKFPVSPKDGCPSYCDYSSICRVQQRVGSY